MNGYADAFAFVFLAVVVVFCVILMGVAGLVWARAIAEVQRARAHRISADAQDEIERDSRKALEDIEDNRERVSRDYTPPPSEDELDEAVFATRLVRERRGLVRKHPDVEGMETATVTTEENELRDPDERARPSIPADQMYVPPEGSVL